MCFAQEIMNKITQNVRRERNLGEILIEKMMNNSIGKDAVWKGGDRVVLDVLQN